VNSRKAKLAKIRKCLALSRSANEHEAAAALEMARKLMADLGLSDDDAAFIDVEESAARGSRCIRPAMWEALLAATVARAIGCDKFLDENSDWRFVGRGPAAEIAAYAFRVLYRQLKSARGDYIRTKLRRCKVANKRCRADAFCEGWASAVYRKVTRIAPEFDDAAVDQYIAKHHSDLVVVDRRRANVKKGFGDYLAGSRDGSNVDLNRGVHQSATRLIAHG
jgi:hypothetical protein